MVNRPYEKMDKALEELNESIQKVKIHDSNLAVVVARGVKKYRNALMDRVEKEFKGRRFPIMEGPSIPWEMILPHERQAKKNHGGQTLERLAERGGLGCSEVVAVLYDRPWTRMDSAEAYNRLNAILQNWEYHPLRKENERLKRGDFTKEEFQALCHKLNEEDKNLFCDGCDEYQRKLFGTCRTDEIRKSIRKTNEISGSRMAGLISRNKALQSQLKGK